MDVCNGIHQMASPNSAVAGVCRLPVLLSYGVRPSVPTEYSLWDVAAYFTSSDIKPLVAGMMCGLVVVLLLLLLGLVVVLEHGSALAVLAKCTAARAVLKLYSKASLTAVRTVQRDEC